MVTHELQVERRTGKVRRPETDVLPLSHATDFKTAIYTAQQIVEFFYCFVDQILRRRSASLPAAYYFRCFVVVAMTSSSRGSGGSGDVVAMAAAAARYRLRQLARQHPPHDSDARHCTSLRDDADRRALVKFDRQRRLRCLGRAQFFTVPPAANDDRRDASTTRCRQVRAEMPPLTD